ncbi:serine hydrolase domain-containing protein [Streptococcus cuniculipharyngis]|uniref:Beta-lactamase family protein n=1 Tax=Streptococcus cuniculipharyngis TaxID=1562651 RepID=A0A5C5SEK4_9STRE|nr:serine hydrolase domain-containing protein [Streptococcus cuniculipharyngis]TWS98211.1 beta-lactamase family protein [Streptococcus cuniculipharyngis]
MTTNILRKINHQINAGIYHGASLSLYDKEKGWQRHYLGTLDGKDLTQADLIYDLASVSKVVGVGTLMIFLLHRGSLELDQTLQTYYPAFQHKQVTLRALLTHSSGLDPFIPNRDQLSANQLIEAMNQLQLTGDQTFHYTDVNFILLGLMLESLTGKSLDRLFQEEIFDPWQMTHTSFGPIPGAVPTLKGITDGQVHDPKAKILGHHTGSAGLFSNLTDLEIFLQHYLIDDFASQLSQNYSFADKERSLAWDLQGDWLLHTGYTGTFIMFNRHHQKAAIFLTNRTYEKDDRQQWIEDRNELIELIKEQL